MPLEVPPGQPEGQPLPLGQFLVSQGLLTPARLQEALREQSRQPGRALGEILMELKLVSEDTLLQALARQGYTVVDLHRVKVQPEAIQHLPEQVARRYEVLPLWLEDGVLVAACWQPGARLVGQLTFAAQRPVRLVLAARSSIREGLDAYYRLASDLGEHLRGRGGGEQVAAALAGGGDPSAVSRTLDLIIAQGARSRASDVHVEPQADQVLVRYRIDGVLHDGSPLPPAMAQPLISRIKVLAGLNIVEHMTPQDGQFLHRAEDRELDIRVSTMPTVRSEKAVLRLLDRRSTFQLDSLGLHQAHGLEALRTLVRRPFGMVVVAGPTGAGKTTTLYAAVHELDRIHGNIVTLEDPVEYHFPRVTQVAVNPKAGLTFAAGLRAALRQDPDVIVVGEIRDGETARIAVQAALTGHLVLSSLHATDTIQAVYRLLDIGVEPYLLAAALTGVVAQRLVRCLCPRCAETVPLTPGEEGFLVALDEPLASRGFRRGVGCGYCAGTGFHGRTGLFETLAVTPELRRLIAQQAPEAEVTRAALEAGLLPLVRGGLRLAAAGVTSLGEVVRVVGVSV